MGCDTVYSLAGVSFTVVYNKPSSAAFPASSAMNINQKSERSMRE
jgi:hypothetical protein